MSAEDNHRSTAEQELIESIKTWTDSRFIGDDCAILPGGLLVSSDSLVEATHFMTEWTSFHALGWKSCAVNLSDIAAMAGRARYLTVSLTLPSTISRIELQRFFEGFSQCAREYRAQVVGGDLTSGPTFMIAVTALGHVHENGCLSRNGAKPDDVVVVTGEFGASAAGLWVMKSRDPDLRKTFSGCVRKHERPLPRLCESWSLVRRTGSRGALMDASDGLGDALAQISRNSGVGMDIDAALIPINDETKEAASLARVDPLDWALYGGEDYELVGTLPREVWQTWDRPDDNPFVKIGSVKTGNNVTLKTAGGHALPLDLSKCFQQIGCS